MKKSTDKKQSDNEPEIPGSDYFYKLIFENSSVGKSITGLDGKLKANRAFCDMLGFTEEEMQSLHWMDITHPDDIDASKQMVENLIKGNDKSAKIEKRYLHKNGTIVWAAVNTYLQHDDQGNAQFFITNILDITQIKKTQEELRLKDQAMVSALNAIAISDLAGTLTYINPSFFRLWGYENESEVLGRNTAEFWMLAEKAVEVMTALQQNGAWAGELTGHKKDGSCFPVEVSANMVLNTGGSPVGMMASFRDITENKKAIKALQVSQERLQFAMDGADLGIWNWDLHTGELIWSDRCKVLFGLDKNEPVSYPRFSEALHPDDRQRTDNAVKEALDNHKDYDIEYRSLWPDQSIHWLAAKGRGYYDSNGTAIRMEGVVMDINEHKNAVESLRENEERYNLANRATFNIIWDWNIQTNLICWNDHFKTQFGYLPEEIQPGVESWTSRIHPEDLNRVESSVHNAIESGENYWNDNYRFMCKNGKINDIEDRGYIVRDQQGRPLRMIGAMMVVTERKQAEAKLKESLALLRMAGETAKLGGWSVNLNENISYWSDQVAAIHEMPVGYSPLVKDGIGFYAPEWREKITQVFTACAQKGIPYNEEMEIITANGKRVWVQTIGEAVRDESNNIVKVHGAFQDISERKQAEESLKRYTERLQNLHKIDLAILQAIESPEAIAKTALQHIRELLHCQRASVGIFDLEKKNVQIFAADVAGKTIVQLGEILTDEVYGDIEILHQGRMEIIEDMANNKFPSAILRILQAEGIQASINVPLVSAQKLYGVMNVGWEHSRAITKEETEIAGEAARQITLAVEQAHLLHETKRYAADLEHRVEERTAQLVAANKEMEAFSYSVSHDLRAPLRHISGYVELLMARFKENLPEKAQHYINSISESIGEMGKLIDDLLKFSRTGKTELDLKPINMKEVFDEAFSQVVAADPGRIIKWDISSMPTVTVDYNLLSMVWYNLLSNAVKFTRNRKTAKIEVGVKEEESQFIFYVRDNGVGFDMQYAQKLFGVFQRLHPVADFEGTGIGLANVRRTISRHGGITWAEAVPDKGATFYFTLPKKS